MNELAYEEYNYTAKKDISIYSYRLSVRLQVIVTENCVPVC